MLLISSIFTLVESLLANASIAPILYIMKFYKFHLLAGMQQSAYDSMFNGHHFKADPREIQLDRSHDFSLIPCSPFRVTNLDLNHMISSSTLLTETPSTPFT